MTTVPPFPGVKAVSFDAAGTLLHPRPSVGAIYREVMAQHGLDYAAEELQAGFRHAFKTVRKDSRITDGEEREWLYWRSIVRTSVSGLDPQPADFDSLFQDLWSTFASAVRWSIEPTAEHCLQELRKRGYRTCLLTNWDKRVRQVLKETQLDTLFDWIFVSSEIGFDKPDARVFEHCSQELGMDGKEILHVGDSFHHDIAGAREAGWQAVHFAPEDTEGSTEPVTVNRLSQLLELLA